MEIFYTEENKFLENIGFAALEKFSDGRCFGSQEKYIEHLCGIYLVKSIAKDFYNIKNPEIIKINSKPYFKNSDIKFSLSHSGNIAAAAFHTENIGLDVEKISQRNYKKIMKRYGIIRENPTAENFYKFWTLHEAEIKLGTKSVSKFVRPLPEDYMLSCVSDVPILSDFAVYRI